MSTGILVIGESGTGKSRSIKTLKPEETFIIKILDKDLPFKRARIAYTVLDKENNPNGNTYSTSDINIILKLLQYINDNMPQIKVIVIDDFQYLMSMEFMNRINENGSDQWQVYKDIAFHAFQVMQEIKFLRRDITSIMLSHSEIDKDTGKTKMKTIGKMTDQYVVPEGIFSVVINSIIKDGQYQFLTQNLGNNIAKSPEGMLELYMPNDLKLVIEKMHAYYEEDIEMDKPLKPVKNKALKQEKESA